MSLKYEPSSEPLHISANPYSTKQVSNKHIQNLAMAPGDVLLIDNYRLLHGRDVLGGREGETEGGREGEEGGRRARPCGVSVEP